MDGTRIKAFNNKGRNFTKTSLAKLIDQSDERLARYLAQLDASDTDEFALPGGGHADDLETKIEAIRHKRSRLKGYLTTLQQSGESQLSLTDPDARAMARMPGHEGHSRSLHESPDEIVNHRPDICPQCLGQLGEDLAGDVVGAYDAIEVPPIAPFVVRHRRLCVSCPHPVPTAHRG